MNSNKLKRILLEKSYKDVSTTEDDQLQPGFTSRDRSILGPAVIHKVIQIFKLQTSLKGCTQRCLRLRVPWHPTLLRKGTTKPPISRLSPNFHIWVSPFESQGLLWFQDFSGRVTTYFKYKIKSRVYCTWMGQRRRQLRRPEAPSVRVWLWLVAGRSGH